MKQTALEQLKKSPLFANSMSTHFLFCLAGQDFAKEEMKVAKNGIEARTIFARVACNLYDEHGQGETPQAISWCIWHWAANKGFIFTPVTALLPRTAIGFLLLSCRVNLPLTGGSGWCRCRRTAPGTASPGVIAANRSPSSPPTPPNFSWRSCAAGRSMALSESSGRIPAF